MMIASLRDAEIALSSLQLQLDKLKVQPANAPTPTATDLIKQLHVNQVGGATTSGDIPNYTPNTLPPIAVKEIIYDSSSSLAGLPTGLGTNDQGQLYYNSFFKRYWFWDGAAWHYNDSGVGAGGQVTTSGPAPEGGLWVACDGNVYQCALDNATIGNKTASPAQATGGNNPIIQGGAGDTSQHAATSLGLTGGSTFNSAVDTGAGQVVQSGAGVTVAAHTHVHSITLPVILAPTDAAGLGLRVSMAWWMRR